MFGWFKEKKLSNADGPDFSSIDSQQKAIAAWKRGELEKLLLIPLRFGGQDDRQNIVYVPIGISDVKAGIDANIIEPLTSEGKVSEYEALPEYEGRTFIPIAIKITASNPGKFTTVISIWGKALERASATQRT